MILNVLSLILAICKLVAAFAIFYYLRETAYFVINKMKRIETGKYISIFERPSEYKFRNGLYQIYVMSFIGIASLIIPHTPIGVEEIGHILEKYSYETYYYAELYDFESDLMYGVEVITLIQCEGNYYTPSCLYLDDEKIEIDFSEDLYEFEELIYLESEKNKVYYLEVYDEKVSKERLERLGLN